MKQKGQDNFTRNTKGFGRVDHGKAGYTDGAGCSKESVNETYPDPRAKGERQAQQECSENSKVRYPRTINWTGVICRRFLRS